MQTSCFQILTVAHPGGKHTPVPVTISHPLVRPMTVSLVNENCSLWHPNKLTEISTDFTAAAAVYLFYLSLPPFLPL